MASSAEDLIRLTAKRSVFSADEMRLMYASPSDPVKVIDFLLGGHVRTPVGLDSWLESGVFAGRPPQSIAQLSEERYQALRPFIDLGFDL